MSENTQNVRIPKQQTTNMGSVVFMGVSLTALAGSLLANAFNSNVPDFPLRDGIDPFHTGSISSLINESMTLDQRAELTGRRIAGPDEQDLISVGKLDMRLGGCTESAVNFLEYETTQDGILTASAAHCVLGQDPNSFIFSKEYFDANGVKRTFSTSTTPQVWINYQYIAESQSAPVNWSGVSPHDVALIFYPNEKLPEEITPIEQYVFNYHLTHYNNNKTQALAMTAPGYAGDLDRALSVDDNCNASGQKYGNFLLADCVINKGASGGPMLGANDLGGVMSLGIASGVTSQDGVANHHSEDYQSFYATFNHPDMHDVPFLKKKEICAVVNDPDGANLREAPDVRSKTNGSAIPGFDTVLKMSSMLDRESVETGLKNIWTHVMNTPDGRHGYIRRDLLKNIDCSAIKKAASWKPWKLKL